MEYKASDKILVGGEGEVVAVTPGGDSNIEPVKQVQAAGPDLAAHLWTKDNGAGFKRDVNKETASVLDFSDNAAKTSQLAFRVDGLKSDYKSPNYAVMADGLGNQSIQPKLSTKIGGGALYRDKS